MAAKLMLLESKVGMGNMSERTIQAMQNTSQMILPKDQTMNNFNGRNYPAWMVNSQIVNTNTVTVDPGKSRVVTRKLNQVVQNPPSMASMGLRHTTLAAIDKKKKRR